MTGLRSASFVFAALILSAPVARAQSEMSFAEQRYRRGVELFVAGNYTQALSEFENSLQLFESPNARLFVARCLQRLNRPVQALAEFERTLRDADERARNDARYVATRDAARDELRIAEQRVGRLTIVVRDPPSELRVTVEGVPILPAALGLPLPVAPGPVAVTVTAPAHVAVERQVFVEAGHREQMTVTLLPIDVLPRASASPAPVPHVTVDAHHGTGRSSAMLGVGITGITIGVLGLAGFGVTYGFAVDEFHRLEMACPEPMGCADSPDEAVARGRALEIGAYTSLAIGIASTALGVGFLIASPRGTHTTTRVVLGPGRIGVTCEF